MICEDCAKKVDEIHAKESEVRGRQQRCMEMRFTGFGDEWKRLNKERVRLLELAQRVIESCDHPVPGHVVLTVGVDCGGDPTKVSARRYGRVASHPIQPGENPLLAVAQCAAASAQAVGTEPGDTFEAIEEEVDRV